MLAGELQAACLMCSIARRFNTEDLDTCLASLLKIDATGSVDIYSDLYHLRSGLNLPERQLRDPIELTGYAVALIRLERKLSKRNDLLQAIRASLGEITRNLSNFLLNHSSTL